jgi:hypothetical protein
MSLALEVSIVPFRLLDARVAELILDPPEIGAGLPVTQVA